MVTTQKITANTSFFMVALVFQKLLSFIYFTFLARYLGAEATGQYFFAVSFATMFSVLIDIGLSTVLIKEVAKNSPDNEKWFHQIFTLKLLFSVVTALLIIVLDRIFFYNDQVRTLIYLTTAIVAVDSFILLFYAFIRGRQNLRYESWGTMIFQIIVLSLGFSLIQFTKNVFLFLIVLFTASLFNLIYSGLVLNKRFRVKFRLVYSKKLVKKILLITLPFALAAIFAKVYAYIDTFFLKLFLGDAEVGFYSVAYKITFALQFIPLAFVASLYPAFSDYFKNDYQSLRKVLVKSFNYLAFISLPISLGIVALAEEIINKIYTESFSYSILPLQILIISIPFLFINFALSYFLNATDRQKINTRNLGLVMVLNIVLNLILIPRLGIWGASLASSISTICLFSLNLQAVSKVIELRWGMFRTLFYALFSALVMLPAVYFLKTVIYWPLTIIVGGLLYFILMFITGALKKADLIFIKNSFSRSKSR